MIISSGDLLAISTQKEEPFDPWNHSEAPFTCRQMSGPGLYEGVESHACPVGGKDVQV
jgi:hypothetical protein